MRFPSASTGSASTGFILATIALDALSFAIIIPVVPDLVMQIGHLPHSQTSLWLGIVFAVFAGMQFLCAPIAGGLSDRFGRRPVLLISMAALGVNSLLWIWVPNLWWLLALRVIAGALAGNVSAATAYVADVTPPEGRARAFGLVGAMFGLGFVVGPALGGWLGSYWIRLPFLVSGALIACNVLYGLLVLPESLPPERRRPFSWARANPIGSLALFNTNGWTRRLGFAWCCSWVAIGAQQSSFILSNQMRFGWSIAENGLVLAIGGMTQALVQGVLVNRINSRYGTRRTAIIGYLFAVAGYVAYAFAVRSWIMLLGILMLAVAALSGPSIQSMLSIAAGPQRQGETQGGLSSLQGLSMVAGPVTTGFVFQWATRPGGPMHFPGAPFMLAAIACLGGLLAVLSLPKPEAVSTTAPDQRPATPEQALQPG
ncbi:MAG: MFS transporter [Janthinobacterium lividum]